MVPNSAVSGGESADRPSSASRPPLSKTATSSSAGSMRTWSTPSCASALPSFASTIDASSALPGTANALPARASALQRGGKEGSERILGGRTPGGAMRPAALPNRAPRLRSPRSYRGEVT